MQRQNNQWRCQHFLPFCLSVFLKDWCKSQVILSLTKNGLKELSSGNTGHRRVLRILLNHIVSLQMALRCCLASRREYLLGLFWEQYAKNYHFADTRTANKHRNGILVLRAVPCSKLSKTLTSTCHHNRFHYQSEYSFQTVQ